MDDFVTGYNHDHHHTGIGLHTPADVHYGLADDRRRRSASAALAAARAAHPERFATTTDPKILALPDRRLDQPTRRPTEPADQPPPNTHWPHSP